MAFWIIKQDALIFIVSGTVEGIIEESLRNNTLRSHQSHPLGRCLNAFASSFFRKDNDKFSGKAILEANDPSEAGSAYRIPYLLVHGPGAVLGAGRYLAYLETIPYRARTQVSSVHVS